MSVELREAIARLGPSKGPTTLVLTRDLTLVLSALQEAGEALTKARRILSNPDQHELTRMCDARDVLVLALKGDADVSR